MRKKPVGIRRDRYGFRAYVRVGKLQRERRFRPDTPLSVMQAWRDSERVRLRALAPATSPAGTLAKDIDRYLRAVSAMPSFASRRTDLLAWLPRFGSRTRASLQRWELLAQVNDWIADGLAASTIRHRKVALVGVWTVLDGRDAACPARTVPTPREPRPQARGLDVALAWRLIRAMPNRGRAPRFGTRPVVSLSKLRLAVMLATGLTPEQIGAVTPSAFDAKARTLRVGERRKGRGAEARTMPLTVAGADALAALLAAGGCTRFSSGSIYRSLHVARKVIEAELLKAGTPLDLSTIRPYDFRHTFATDLYRRTGDLKVVKELLGHSSLAMTERYMKGGVDAHVARVVASLDTSDAGSVGCHPPQPPDTTAES